MDPVTVVQILSAISKYVESSKQTADLLLWQENVSSNLNKIIANTESILRNLKSLKIELIDSMENQFRTHYMGSLTAALTDVNDIISGIDTQSAPRSEDKIRLQQACDRLRNEIKQALSYGFAVVPLVLGSYLVLIGAMKFADFPEREISSTKTSIYSLVFEPSLNEGIGYSFSGRLLSARKLAGNRKVDIENHFRTFTMGIIYKESPKIEPEPPLPRGGFRIPPPTIVYAAVCTFHGDADDINTIGATEIELRRINQPGVSWDKVDPPTIPGSGQASTETDAKRSRIEWLTQIRGWAAERAAHLNDERQLEEFVNQIRKITQSI